MNVKKISILSLFIALSVVGAMIKVPAIVSSVALDAFPGMVAAAVLGGGAGAIVGGVGHLVSALFGGMPMGPLHMIVAVEMALLMWMFGYLYKKGKKILVTILFIIGNAFVFPVPFIFILGPSFYMAIVPSLLIGATINAILAVVAIPRIHSIYEEILLKSRTY